MKNVSRKHFISNIDNVKTRAIMIKPKRNIVRSCFGIIIAHITCKHYGYL